MSSKQPIFKFKIAGNKPERKFHGLFYSLLFLFTVHCSLLTAHCSPLTVSARKIAFLAPDGSPDSQKARENLERFLSGKFQISNDSLVETVLLNAPDQNIFNLSAEEARNFGKAAGCNFFVLVKAETLRRASFSKSGFYIESYAVVYLVSSRTGRLDFWKLLSFQGNTATEAETKLSASIENLAWEISANIKSADEKEMGEEPSSNLEELPVENSDEAKNFRIPLPYRRIKPEYTALASLYNVAATIDASVDLDENGVVKQIEITRWAGYGLDESVAETIRKMQWRAAEKDGKTLPIRALLRYNFKKIEKDE